MSICNLFHQINEHFQLDPSDYLVFTTYFIRLMSIYKLIPSYLWAFTTWFHRQELSRFLFSCCLISSPLEGQSNKTQTSKPSPLEGQLETNPDFFTKKGRGRGVCWAWPCMLWHSICGQPSWEGMNSYCQCGPSASWAWEKLLHLTFSCWWIYSQPC